MTHPHAIIETADKRHRISALLGQTVPSISGGRGGWQEVARPRQPTVIEWIGADALKASLVLMLDQWRSSKSLASTLSVIESIAPKSPKDEPPTVYVLNAWPIPNNVPFTVQAVDYSDSPLKLAGGAVARVEVTFTLVEVRLPNVLVRASPAKSSTDRHSSSSRSKVRTVTVHAGDSLGSIAAKYLGKSSDWTLIAKANGLRDPNHLKVGSKLKIP